METLEQPMLLCTLHWLTIISHHTFCDHVFCDPYFPIHCPADVHLG